MEGHSGKMVDNTVTGYTHLDLSVSGTPPRGTAFRRPFPAPRTPPGGGDRRTALQLHKVTVASGYAHRWYSPQDVWILQTLRSIPGSGNRFEVRNFIYS